MIAEKLKEETVFIISAGLILTFIGLGILYPKILDTLSSGVNDIILDNFSWLYLTSAFFFLIFSLALAISKFGTIKLGNEGDRPQYSFFGWVAMLFAAGMGIGLIFWGVSEPIIHFIHPPPFLESATPGSAEFAMRYSFFHWGIHPWAIYTIVSISIAYFSFRRGMPALISSCFYPLLGERIYGISGKLVDVLAVFATIFGTATSLGFGALQIQSGLTHLYGISSAISVTIGIIIIATALFMASAIIGIEKGVQTLSKINISLAAGLLVFILLLGPAPEVLNIFSSSMGGYINNIVDMSLQSYPFEGDLWSREWTIFYWAWWISWSPFVGLFIAQISRGRTIREFVLTVLTVPPLFTFFWFSVFGGSALLFERNSGISLADTAGGNISVALFVFLENYPFSSLLALLTIFLLMVFFITSADSATVVLSSLTSGGGHFIPVYKKIIWGLSLSAVAIILIFTGGLSALQTMAITAAFPFLFVMLLLCYNLYVGLSQEMKMREED
jgi:glycine betaine transporter